MLKRHKVNRNQLADLIFSKIEKNKDTLVKQFQYSKPEIGFFYLDDLLPEDIALKIFNFFPKPVNMVLKKSLRENKYVAAQMNQYDSILEEIIYAFQDIRIVTLIAEICVINDCFPDEKLYAGGISLMEEKQYLNPHLDNSHDKERERWRVLNLLYYVTPNWKLEYGGNLELWPNGLKNKQITIESKFNRLAVMATHNKSLHSVSPVVVNNKRCCVSNYYFSNSPLQVTDSFHVTSFRGRPENKITDIILQTDTWLRNGIRKIFKKGIKENPHYYNKEK
ncbi:MULTISPECIES: 2OG-Fe(II) oxygenase [Flavobacterium]|uniref:2OG-Fe(II) oxygenase n=1 Tax=Flavobacterium jumunjinense TaxID=998845 RepID=A0ABV5GI38_9FLAO|nr:MULTISPECIES: 2OG-Fe(II) oxygenase [Flavobacterium]